MQEYRLNTKTRIFLSALYLFASRGVENASMREIAFAAGINIASIYNHFINKEQILEACYDFYLDYHDSTKLSEEQYAAILRTGTKEEIVDVLNFGFSEEHQENLVNAMTILFSRMYSDPKAIEKYSKMVDHSMEFMKSFFELGIQLGRFEEFDVNRVSLLFLSARLFAAQSVIIHPETLRDIESVEKEMMKELINNIPFKY